MCVYPYICARITRHHLEFSKGGGFVESLVALEMASHSSCCSVLPFSITGPRFAAVSSISVGQSHPSYRFGLSFRPGKRIGDARKSHSRFSVSCLRDTNGMQNTQLKFKKCDFFILFLQSDLLVLNLDFHSSISIQEQMIS